MNCAYCGLYAESSAELMEHAPQCFAFKLIEHEGVWEEGDLRGVKMPLRHVRPCRAAIDASDPKQVSPDYTPSPETIRKRHESLLEEVKPLTDVATVMS